MGCDEQRGGIFKLLHRGPKGDEEVQVEYGVCAARHCGHGHPGEGAVYSVFVGYYGFHCDFANGHCYGESFVAADCIESGVDDVLVVIEWQCWWQVPEIYASSRIVAQLVIVNPGQRWRSLSAI